MSLLAERKKESDAQRQKLRKEREDAHLYKVTREAASALIQRCWRGKVARRRVAELRRGRVNKFAGA